MKKICLVTALLISSVAVFAQNVNYGLKAGLNLSTITNLDEAKLKPGVHLGGLAHFHITPAFSIQPEIMFSTQGAKTGNDSKLNLGYVNIPVLLQYNFDNGFRLQGGPQLGINTGAKSKSGNIEVDVSDNIKAIDFSIPLGISYLTASGLGIDGRYNIGITNVFENSLENYSNSVIQLGLFYLLNNKHKERSR